MDIRSLSQTVPMLIVERKFEDAERMLQKAHAKATKDDDFEALDHLSALFVNLYCSLDPPDASMAERYCLERERIRPSAYTKLQTAMVLYYVKQDVRRAAEKLRDAIEQSKRETDSSVQYSSLSLLGQVYLDLNQTKEVGEVLNEMEKMIADRRSIVVGDETLLLEKAFAKGVATIAVRRIAKMLAPVCRDEEFAQRLNVLAAGG